MQGCEDDVLANELGQKGWLDGWTSLLHAALQLQVRITAQAPAGSLTLTYRLPLID